MNHSDSAKRQRRIRMYLVLISAVALVFTLKIYLPLRCARLGSKNVGLARKTQLTFQQQRQLTQFILEDIHGTHPHYSYGFGIVASKRNYACVEVHVGRDLRLHRTPDPDQEPGDYSENWAMLYFLGHWWKLGASRFRD
jgi:hypothetical protein